MCLLVSPLFVLLYLSGPSPSIISILLSTPSSCLSSPSIASVAPPLLLGGLWTPDYPGLRQLLRKTVLLLLCPDGRESEEDEETE